MQDKGELFTNYLFFDMEYATSKGGIEKICEFGYVLVNENFDVLESDNFVMDPCIKRSEWDWRVVKTILNRKIEEYENSPRFDYYYEKIKKLILESDYIFGHTLFSDVTALYQNCRRYGKESFDFDFYDIKEFYKKFRGTQKNTSVINILKELNIEHVGSKHDAKDDAFNTMLGLKEMMVQLKMTLDELIFLVPESKDNSKKYSIEAIEELHAKQEAEFMKTLKCGDGTNNLLGTKSTNYKRFIEFLDNVKPTRAGNILDGNGISISINYEENHFKQMLNLVQLIVNEGGKYVKRASSSNLFVRYDAILEDGSIKRDSRLNYVLEAIDKGSKIKIINFYDFLAKLSISEEQLNEMPMPSFEFLLKDTAVIQDRRDASIIKRRKNPIKIDRIDENGNIIAYADDAKSTTLGDLFGDVFDKLSFDD